MHKTVPSICGSTSLTMGAIGWRRGDTCTWSGGATHRIVNMNSMTLTIRPLHRWRIVEAARFAWERAIAWPCADAWLWVRA